MTPLEFMRLFPEFRADSWGAWRKILGRMEELLDVLRELFIMAGRGGGKTRIAALILTCWACRKYERVPGERIYASATAPDRKQAAILHGYVSGFLHAHPALEAMIEAERAQSIDLKNGVTIEIVSGNKVAPRGRAYCVFVIDEAAYLPQDESVSPDVELVRAVKPGLARVRGSLMMAISSPYAKRGILFRAWQKYKDGDPSGRVLFIRKPTEELNPSFDAEEIKAAYEEDPAGAASEYGAQFRRDIESFIRREVLESLTVEGRYEIEPLGRVNYRDTTYHAFVDPSGGSRDSFSLAIGHTERRPAGTVAILDLVREHKAPFSPESAVASLADDLKRYRVKRVTGDRYAGAWPSEAFKRHGITYQPADRPKSDLYRDCLPVLNSGRAELLDHPRLIDQFASLERRTSRGGRDSIDHGPGGRDDLCNAVAGLLVTLAVNRKRKTSATWGHDMPRTVKVQTISWDRKNGRTVTTEERNL